ncbi:MAG: YecH family protein [Candidatus Marinimicrobia bacterium]|nr:YecH family protein [Candidatus Neomarinimicrobiota bacterium]
MQKKIHGSEVIQMMVQSRQKYTKERLISVVNEKFGSDTLFYTCSADNLSVADLADFLLANGKFLDKDEVFTINCEQSCGEG